MRVCTGPEDTGVRVCVGMKAEAGDELTVSQVPCQPQPREWVLLFDTRSF